MNVDMELAAWRADWLAHQPSDTTMLAIDLRRLVDRKRRQMALSLFGHLLFGLALLAFSGWIVSRMPTLEWILWAAVIWITTFLAAGFSVWNTRGTWQALSQSNAAFLALSRERCLRQWRTNRVGRWFLAVQLAIVGSWLSWDFAVHRLTLGRYLIGGAVTILMAVAYLEWFAYRERRIRRDLGRFDDFESEPSS
jgi:hypothetical protein